MEADAVLNPSESFLALKKVNPRILSTFKRSFSKIMGKISSSHIIHSLGGEYCWIVRDSEPVRLLKSPRSLSVYILIWYIIERVVLQSQGNLLVELALTERDSKNASVIRTPCFQVFLEETVETGDKNRDYFHCMQMSLVMSMRLIFGNDWNDACKLIAFFAVWQWCNFPRFGDPWFSCNYARV